MKSAKEFYEIYDIPHPQKLLSREELMFDTLSKAEQTYITTIKSQQADFEKLAEITEQHKTTRYFTVAGIIGLVAGMVILIGLNVSNGEKRALQREVKALTQQQELLQRQSQRREQELNKRIEILVNQNEELMSSDAALLQEDNARLKAKNAQLNSEIIKIRNRCIGKFCLR
ncbi:MAG: hypothetical protein HC815_04055 [Richelia sp. RM1_1_1]|nr:hypothetical protein [Richelia sp. RM1_1_1]